MQARYASLLLATAVIAAASVAAAQQTVQAPPSQAQGDYYLRLPDIDGESGAPATPGDVQSQTGGPQAGLLLPAIQKARDASPRSHNGAPATQNADLTPGSSPQHAPSSPPPPPPPPPPPSPNGHVPVDQISLNFSKMGAAGEHAPREDAAPNQSQGRVRSSVQPPYQMGAAAGQDEESIGLLLPAVQGDPPPPPPPPPPQNAETEQQVSAAAQEQPRERPRRNFSLTIGGVTVGTAGVNVAVGDVNGDGRNSRARGRNSSSGGSTSAGRGSSTAGAPRR